MKKKVTILLVIVFFVVGFFTIYLSRGINVIVENRGGESIKNLSIDFTGGNHFIGELLPQESNRAGIKPTSESDLKVSFTDSLGNNKTENIDLYIEPGYSGTIYISIDSTNGNVTWYAEINYW